MSQDRICCDIYIYIHVLLCHIVVLCRNNYSIGNFNITNFRGIFLQVRYIKYFGKFRFVISSLGPVILRYVDIHIIPDSNFYYNVFCQHQP